jgi:phosphoribosylanthranilate isomerase
MANPCGRPKMNTMKIKVCGMRNAENIQTIAALPIDYMGFIFYEKSPRYVTHPNAKIQNADSIKTVGVFVNEKIEIIVQKIIEYQLDAVQLHGNETNDFIRALRRGEPLRSPNVAVARNITIINNTKLKNKTL